MKFTSSEAGNYFYKVVDHGATAPTADEIMKSTTHGTASAGETTITLSNLTEGARDIYIVVVGAAGGESTALKVEIPAYGSGTDTPDTGAYKISISAPKGGTITTNRTKANAGDEIIVTVTPDSGYQMVSGSLTYTLAIAGGETKTITNGRFTMPAVDVSITCKWETATTTAKGITSFSINSYRSRLMEAGAQGLIGKEDSDQLAKAIERLCGGNVMEGFEPPALANVRIRREEETSPRLTVREEQIISLCADGMLDREIAEQLDISESTVRKHMQGILKKLNCKTARQAVALWVRSHAR